MAMLLSPLLLVACLLTQQAVTFQTSQRIRSTPSRPSVVMRSRPEPAANLNSAAAALAAAAVLLSSDGAVAQSAMAPSLPETYDADSASVLLADEERVVPKGIFEGFKLPGEKTPPTGEQDDGYVVPRGIFEGISFPGPRAPEAASADDGPCEVTPFGGRTGGGRECTPTKAQMEERYPILRQMGGAEQKQMDVLKEKKERVAAAAEEPRGSPVVPKKETPRMELPKIEAPKFQLPKIEAPKIELPNKEKPAESSPQPPAFAAPAPPSPPPPSPPPPPLATVAPVAPTGSGSAAAAVKAKSDAAEIVRRAEAEAATLMEKAEAGILKAEAGVRKAAAEKRQVAEDLEQGQKELREQDVVLKAVLAEVETELEGAGFFEFGKKGKLKDKVSQIVRQRNTIDVDLIIRGGKLEKAQQEQTKADEALSKKQAGSEKTRAAATQKGTAKIAAAQQKADGLLQQYRD